MKNMFWLFTWVLASFHAIGCRHVEKVTVDTDEDTTTSTDSGLTDSAIVSCEWENPYSRMPECREYVGPWTAEDARADCSEIFSGIAGTLDTDECEHEGAIGTCTVALDDERSSVTWYYGGSVKVTSDMCRGYLGGVWEGEESEPPDAGHVLMEEAIEAMASDDGVTVSPECTDDECLANLADNEEWITFTPRGGFEAGLIIYPGADVDPRAYAPTARTLAARGNLLVSIVPMPGNFALNGCDRAGLIIAENPAIDTWLLGGHSVGGASALKYIYETPGEIDGVFLWAAYPDGDMDLSASSVPMISIHATNDGICTVEEIDDRRSLLPPNAIYAEVRGGNHAQFGYYGDQEGDFSADISRERQQELTTSATLHFLEGLLHGRGDPNPVFEDAAAEQESWCAQAQLIVANVEGLTAEKMTTHWNQRVGEFGQTDAVLDPGDAESPLELNGLLMQTGNPRHLGAPPLIEGHAWCKMKSQNAVVQGLELTPAGAPGTCADVNEAALEWALDGVSEQDRRAYEDSGIELRFGADVQTDSGPAWLTGSDIELSEESGVYTLTSPALSVDDDPNVPETKREVVYCKVWTPSEALLWVLGATR